MLENLGYEKKEATRFTIKYDYQSMSVEEWRAKYFKLIAWKNTWGAWELDIHATRDHSAFIRLVVGRSFRDSMKDYLEELGFLQVEVADITVGLVELYDEEVDTIYFA